MRAPTAAPAMSTRRSTSRRPTTGSTSTSAPPSRRAASSPICSSCRASRRSRSTCPAADRPPTGGQRHVRRRRHRRHPRRGPAPVHARKASAIEAKGDGDFERFMPEDLGRCLQARRAFDIAGTLTSAGGVDIERATIESNAVTRHGVGHASTREGASDFALQVDAAGEGVPLSFGTEDSPIDMVVQSASVRALGDGREPNLDIAASLSKVATNDAELDDLAIALHSDALQHQEPQRPGDRNRDRGGADHRQSDHRAAGRRQDQRRNCRHAWRRIRLTVDRRQSRQRRHVRQIHRRRVAGRRLGDAEAQGRCGVGGAAGVGAPGPGRTRRNLDGRHLARP